MSGIFNPSIWNNSIFNTGAAGPITPPAEPDVKTGTGGLDGRIVKPSGLPFKRPTLHLKKKNEQLRERLEQQIDDQIQIVEKLSKEFTKEPRGTLPQMSMQEVEAEIGLLLKKKLRTDDDEILLLTLLAICNA